MIRYYFDFKNFALTFFLTGCILSCSETSIEVPVVDFDEVSVVTCDSLTTKISYDANKSLTEFNVYVNDNHKYKTEVKYLTDEISCYMDGLHYIIKLANTKGGVRAESVTTYINDGVAINSTMVYRVTYDKYDDAGRLEIAGIEKYRENGNSIVYCNYKYYGNDSIVIDEYGQKYVIRLAEDQDNTGVCNVLDFAGGPLTSEYVINPILYYLKIYGVPISKLPAGQVVKRSSDSRLTRVGKYYFSY